MSISEFLRERTIGDVIFEKNSVVDVEASTPLDKVLTLLAENQIRAMPVYSQKQDGGQKYYLGVISTFDIVSLVVFSTTEGQRGHFHFDADFSKTSAGDVVQQRLGEGEKVWLFDGSDTLVTLCEAFGQGVYRGIVHQKDDHTGRQVVRLVSQSDLLRFFVRHEQQLQPSAPIVDALGLPINKKIWNKSVEELGLCNPLGEVRKVLEITTQDTAMYGFRLMALSSLQSLPILDQYKRLVTTLSVADLRGVTHETLKDMLFLPVMDYLRNVYGTNNTFHPITCKPRDTLWEVLVKLTAAKIHKHQAWITGPDDRVLGVVSLSDIIQKVSLCSEGAN